MHVSLSSEVLPRIREWPRLSTTLLNAYLEPIIVRYVAHLAAGHPGDYECDLRGDRQADSIDSDRQAGIQLGVTPGW